MSHKRPAPFMSQKGSWRRGRETQENGDGGRRKGWKEGKMSGGRGEARRREGLLNNKSFDLML